MRENKTDNNGFYRFWIPFWTPTVQQNESKITPEEKTEKTQKCDPGPPRENSEPDLEGEQKAPKQ